MEENNNIIPFCKERIFISPLCPACYIRVESDSFWLSEDVFLHSNPTCIYSWASFSEEERFNRICNVRSLATEGLLVDMPNKPGKYWAIRKGGGMLIPVEIFYSNGSLMVKGARSVRGLEHYLGYAFISKKAA